MYQRPHARSPRAIEKDYRFARLPMTIDPAPLVTEIRRALLSWLPSQWKWHLKTELCILRAGVPGRHPGSALVRGTGIDMIDLLQLPGVAEVLDTSFPVPAALAWIGRMPAGTCIHLHVDNTRHWDEHHRIHVPLSTHAGARMCIGGRFEHFGAGSVWAFNNSLPHAAINDGPDRLHLVLDLPPVPEVEALINAGTRTEGAADPAALERVSRDPLTALTDAERADRDLMARLALQ